MTLVERYHAEHKARLARLGAVHAPAVKTEPPTNYTPVKASIGVKPLRPNAGWRSMWFWDLVNPRPVALATYRPIGRKIIDAVAKHYGVSRMDIASQRRTADVVFPRQMVMYLARRLTPMSLPQIGKIIGGRDHTTVLHACRRIEAYRRNYPELDFVIEKLARDIGPL